MAKEYDPAVTTPDPSSDRVDRLASLLLDARRDGVALPPAGPDLIPTDEVEAATVDDAVAARIGRPVQGWKIGCTSEHAQELLGASGPFAGRVYALHQDDGDGVELAPTAFVTEPVLEGEFAFALGADLAARDQPWSREAVAGAVAAVHPAIEVVGGRWTMFIGAPLTCLIADAGANTRLVVGPPAAVGGIADLEALGAAAATMTVDGEVTGRGHGHDVLGHPLDALCWLVEHLRRRGIGLTAGQIITTGTATQVTVLGPGATATASFEQVGSVTLRRLEA